jgi:hypothetical protein
VVGQPEQGGGVPAEHLAGHAGVAAGQPAGEVGRRTQPFGMRVVRAEQDMAGADRVDELADVVLGERADPQLPGQRLAGAGRRLPADHGAAAAQRRGLVDGLEQRLQPA